MTLFQTIFVPACGLFALTVFIRTVRGRILIKNGLFYMLAWTVAAVLIARPALTQVAAGWLGIGRGTDLVLYLAILGGLSMSLYFYMRFRQVEAMLTGILRREALERPEKGRLVNP